MKIKLDENLPHRLATLLKKLGHEAHTLYEEGLVGRSDDDVWKVAQKEARFLITQDLDFSDLRKFAPGSHHGILLVRLRNPSRRAPIERIEEMFSKENINDWARCFVIVTERKIRVLGPEHKRNR